MGVKKIVKKTATVLADSKYVNPKVLGLIRHIFGIAGTVLVILGYSTAEEVTQTGESVIALITNLESLIGEFLIILATMGSWFSKEKEK